MEARHALPTAVCLAALLSGCGDRATTPPRPRAAPTSAGGCVDLPALHGDPGIVLGTDWSGEHHRYGDTVTVYACFTPGDGSVVALVADGTGIEVRPRSVVRDRPSNGVIPFRVTVTQGAEGGLRVRQSGRGLQGDMGGPLVVADGDGWHFVRR